MLQNLQELFKEGKLSLHTELLKKYRPSMLEHSRSGPWAETIALIWSAFQVSDVEGVEKLAKKERSGTPSYGKSRSRSCFGHRGLPRGGASSSTPPNGRRKIIEHCANIPASKRLRPPAVCGAGGKPWAIWTSWSRVKLAARRALARS
jgi:hypothetical protein